MASRSSSVSGTRSGKVPVSVRKSDVSKSTDRRYNEVVQEYMKNKLLKSDSTRSNIPPSSVLTLHADNAGPEEGSYVSPDRNTHGPPLTTFSQADGVLNYSDFSVVQIQTPAESLDLEMSKNGKKTPISPHTPTIRVTSVKGSSHHVFRGTTSEDVTQCPASWKGMSPLPVEREKQRQCKTPLQLDTIYPPDETDVKTYSFTAPTSCTSSKTFIVNTTLPHSADNARSSPNEKRDMCEDLDFNQDQTDYERTLDFRERCGWFLLIVGSALLISSVIVILAIEIPAHRETILGAYPSSEALINYLQEFQDFVLSAPTPEPSVVSIVSATTPEPSMVPTAPVLSDTIELLLPGNEI